MKEEIHLQKSNGKLLARVLQVICRTKTFWHSVQCFNLQDRPMASGEGFPKGKVGKSAAVGKREVKRTAGV